MRRLYGLLERLRLAELRLASAAVLEADRLNDAEGMTRMEAAEASRTALRAGAAEPWATAETTRALSVLRSASLAEERKLCEDLRVQAETAHLASRVQAEQMRSMVEEQERRLRASKAHREQAHADDRFLARRAWLAAQLEKI